MWELEFSYECHVIHNAWSDLYLPNYPAFNRCFVWLCLLSSRSSQPMPFFSTSIVVLGYRFLKGNLHTSTTQGVYVWLTFYNALVIPRCNARIIYTRAQCVLSVPNKNLCFKRKNYDFFQTSYTVKN